jgi:hypothetical protein
VRLLRLDQKLADGVPMNPRRMANVLGRRQDHRHGLRVDLARLRRLEGNDLATAGQGNGIVERDAGLGHLKGSNKPGRIALVRGIVPLRTLAAFIATHLGAELVERHGAEHGIRSRSILNGTHKVPLFDQWFTAGGN